MNLLSKKIKKYSIIGQKFEIITQGECSYIKIITNDVFVLNNWKDVFLPKHYKELHDIPLVNVQINVIQILRNNNIYTPPIFLSIEQLHTKIVADRIINTT